MQKTAKKVVQNQNKYVIMKKNTMEVDFMAKTVIITGATSGYGLAAAKKFKENGDRVIIASRNAEKVAKVTAEYGFDDGYVLDVTSYGNWVSFAEKVTAKYGRIDVLVNNAGGGVKIADTRCDRFVT